MRTEHRHVDNVIEDIRHVDVETIRVVENVTRVPIETIVENVVEVPVEHINLVEV